MELLATKQDWGKIYGFLQWLSTQQTAMGSYKMEAREGKNLCLRTLTRSIEGGELQITRQEENWVFCINTEYEKKEVRYTVEQINILKDALLAQIRTEAGNFESEAIENFLFSVGIYDFNSTSETGEDFIATYQPENSTCILQKGVRFHSLLDRHYLIEANRAANFKFDITQVKLSNPESNKINAIGDAESGSLARLNEIFRLGGRLKYTGVEGKFFTNSLQLIDMHLARLTGELVRLFYTGEHISVKDLTQELNEVNLFKVKDEVIQKSRLYEYKIKQLLYAAACGLKPSRTWKGYSRSDLHIYINPQGELLAYDPSEKELFERFLWSNTRLALPNENKAKYGMIEKENGQWLIKLNLEICFQ